MYILILFLPLLSFIISSVFGRKIGFKGSSIISTIFLFLTLFIVIVGWIEVVIFHSNVDIILWSWFDLGLLSVTFTLKFDNIVLSMLILITFISSLVHLYSTSYMYGDPHLSRFMSYLSLFTFFMIILVTSANLPQLFIGWEGVGLCSYLLIGFWFTRIQANKAAIKAMVINKVGDIGVLLGMILIWYTFGSFSYDTFFALGYFNLETERILNIISVLLLIGVIGKSAQIGLHMWLPDAMEGPTPVSALIHAATMVTAGVFLIIRLSPFFEQTPLILLIIILVGSMTAFFTSTIGLTQNDLKKVIAYSTCSQLGYMVMICGFSQYNAGLFHLINHGFFKALLFLSAGSVIHALNNEQDLRKLGSMKLITPLTFICIVIGSISLMGLPFLTGFYSKDLILELIYSQSYLSYALWLGLIAAFITAFYSFRLIYYTFNNLPQSPLKILNHSHEGNWNLYYPLVILLTMSITIGYVIQNTIMIDEFPIMIPNLNKFMPLYLSVLGALFSIYLGKNLINWWKLGLLNSTMKFYSFSNGAWYFDSFFNHYIVIPVMKIGFSITYKLLDNQLLETIGPTRISNNIYSSSNILSKFHSGSISTYTFAFIMFICCFIFKF